MKVERDRQDVVRPGLQRPIQTGHDHPVASVKPGDRHIGHRRHCRRLRTQGKLQLLEGMACLMHVQFVKTGGADAVNHVEQGLGLGIEGHGDNPE
jgi:hypothetical protein